MSTSDASGKTLDQFVLVDCTLPGRIRRLGNAATFQTARRLVRTTAVDCGTRGGEYTLYDRANLTTSLQVWLVEAQSGDAQAQYYVGELYEHGINGAPDYESARLWYGRSAAQGHSQAKVNLGTLYENGLGVHADKAKALNFYRSAANLDDDQLEYLSTIEKEVEARLKTYKHTLQQEQRKTRQKEREASSLRTLLSRSREELAAIQHQAVREKVIYVEVQASEPVIVKDNATAKQLKQQLAKVSALERELDSKNSDLLALRQRAKANNEAASLKLADSLDNKEALSRLLTTRTEELRAANERLSQLEFAFSQEKGQLLQELSSTQFSSARSNDEIQNLTKQLFDQRLVNKQLGEDLSILRSQETDYVAQIDALKLGLENYRSGSESDAIQRQIDLNKIASLELELSQTKTLVEGQEQKYLLQAGRNEYLEASLASLQTSKQQSDAEVQTLKAAIADKTQSLESSQKQIALLTAQIEDLDAEISGIQIAAANTSVRGRTDRKVSGFGNFYALIIGNNQYRNLPNLKSPVGDARALSNVLENQYGYKTTTLSNATSGQIIAEINRLRTELGENDNLLIYYAGHGEIKNARGYWLPVDAELAGDDNWIPTQQVTDLIANSNIRKVMVVADSCYSGILTRSAIMTSGVDTSSISPEQYKKWLSVMAKGKSRTVMSSGGLQPVLDSGVGKHSIFAKHFISLLDANNDVIDANTLYSQLFPKVKAESVLLNAEQSPQYAPIKNSNHQAVDYFFVKI